MDFRTIRYKTKFHKIKIAVRVWKVQIEIPHEINLNKNDVNFETTKWAICQVLN